MFNKIQLTLFSLLVLLAMWLFSRSDMKLHILMIKLTH